MTFTIAQIKTRITKGLIFIKNEQLSDGSFLSLSGKNVEFDDAALKNNSADKNNTGKDLDEVIVQKTTFITSLILSCLENVSREPHATKIIRTGVRFLLHEKSPSWS